MTSAKDKLLNEYLDYVNEAIIVESARSQSVVFLNEDFTRDEYGKLLKTLSEFNNKLPSLMPSCRQALVKAIDQMQKDYSGVIRGKLDKRVFAKHIAEASNLTKTIVESLREIVGLLQTHDLRSQQVSGQGAEGQSHVGVGSTLGDTLTDSAKDVLTARVMQGFGSAQKTSLWGKLFGSKKQRDWFGLTAEAMANDILSLDRKALLVLGIDKGLVDKYLPEGGPPAKPKAEPESEPETEQSFNEITPGENPDAEIDIDTLSGQEDSPADNVTSKPKRRSLLDLPKSPPKPAPAPTKKQPTKKKAPQKEDLSREDTLIIENWRRLAGIN